MPVIMRRSLLKVKAVRDRLASLKDVSGERIGSLKPRTYVPPQNSMEVREPAALSGSFSRSSTGMPIDTTRTGSG